MSTDWSELRSGCPDDGAAYSRPVEALRPSRAPGLRDRLTGRRARFAGLAVGVCIGNAALRTGTVVAAHALGLV